MVVTSPCGLDTSRSDYCVAVAGGIVRPQPLAHLLRLPGLGVVQQPHLPDGLDLGLLLRLSPINCLIFQFKLVFRGGLYAPRSASWVNRCPRRNCSCPCPCPRS